MSHGESIVVLGAQGMLGRAFSELLARQGRSFRALSRREANLEAPETLREGVRGATVVVNCAAYTNVDGAETDEARATLVNGTAVGILAEACREGGATLVHFSTDYVFDGRATAPYGLDHPRSPLGAYGRSKALGEELLERSGADHLLIRTSWVYAPWGKNFVLTMAGLLRSRETVQVVADQRGRPSEAGALAEGALGLLESGQRGAFHLTDGGECSWYEFTLAIQTILGGGARVTPCTTAQFPRPAPRPSYSVLDLSRAERLLGPRVPYAERLAQLRPAFHAALGS